MDATFRRTFIVLIGLNFLIWIVGMAEAEKYNGYEMPPYVVERADGDFELRRYGAHLLAEVQVEGGRSSSIRQGFRALAKFIFGGNDTGQKIAMTVPVTQEPVSSNVWAIRFMMPAAYDRAALPAPENAAIRMVDGPAERLVVVQFSGLATGGAIDRNTARLRDYAARLGLAVTGPARVSYYDDPFTLPWKRRNEVAFPVD